MLPIIAAVGIGLAAAGAVTSFFGSQDASEAQQRAIAAQQRGEQVRKEAAHFDADRRRRQMIRMGLIQRSQAVAIANAQGANKGSGLEGVFGQIASATSFAVSGVTGNLEYGDQLFAANQELLEARKDSADAESTMALGKGLSSLGGAVLGNIGSINSIGGNLSQGFSNTYNYGSWAGSGYNGSGAPLA